MRMLSKDECNVQIGVKTLFSTSLLWKNRKLCVYLFCLQAESQILIRNPVLVDPRILICDPEYVFFRIPDIKSVIETISLVPIFGVNNIYILFQLTHIIFCTVKILYTVILWKFLWLKKCKTTKLFFDFLFFLLLDPGSGMEKNPDPGSGINVLNPQHCLELNTNTSV